MLKSKNKLKIGAFTNKVGKNSQYFVGVFNKTIIPLAFVTLLVGSLPSHIQRALVEYLLIDSYSVLSLRQTRHADRPVRERAARQT